MIDEQEAVRGRLFTIQDVMQSTVRAWLQVHTHRLFCFRYITICMSKVHLPLFL